MGGKRLFQSVAEQIAALIEDGAFPPGTRLPGERELSERLNVSRVTIREAEIALQAVGKLEIKTGSGVYVSEDPPVPDGHLPEASAFEVTEARLLIEAETAALAARNITDEEVAKLESLIGEMASGDENVSRVADQTFHATIAEAANNAAMVHTVKQLWRMREELPEVKATHQAVCFSDKSTLVNEHRLIFEALRDRDPPRARAAMRKHFERLISSMLDATEKKAMEELQQQSIESRERFLSVAKLD